MDVSNRHAVTVTDRRHADDNHFETEGMSAGYMLVEAQSHRLNCVNPHRLGRLLAEGWGRSLKAGCRGGQTPAVISVWQSMLTNV